MERLTIFFLMNFIIFIKISRVKKGDLVFALTRPVISSGIKKICFYNEEYNSLLNQRNSIYRPDETLVFKNFLYYSVRSFLLLKNLNSNLKRQINQTFLQNKFQTF